MAKKTTPTRRRPVKRTSTRKKKTARAPWKSAVRTFRQLFTVAVIILISFFGFLYLYDNYELGQHKKGHTGSGQVAKDDFHFPDEQPARVTKPTAGSYQLALDDEIPRLLVKRPEQIIRHEGYTVSYNSTYKIANWVAYELTPEEAKSKKEERSNKFVPDPDVKGATALNEDYTRTGYDRGHLAPAGDMKWSAKAMRESFYFSNICPQAPGLNRGIWKTLEEQCRIWAIHNGPLLIVTGPVITGDMKVIGKNRVGVPPSFYKVACFASEDGIHGIGFIFENREYKKVSLQSMAIPIDSVEKVTGIDFFYSLPDEIENRMESKIEWQYWRF